MFQVLDVTLTEVLEELTIFAQWFIEQLIAISNFLVSTPLGLIILGVFLLPAVLSFIISLIPKRGR